MNNSAITKPEIVCDRREVKRESQSLLRNGVLFRVTRAGLKTLTRKSKNHDNHSEYMGFQLGVHRGLRNSEPQRQFDWSLAPNGSGTHWKSRHTISERGNRARPTCTVPMRL